MPGVSVLALLVVGFAGLHGAEPDPGAIPTNSLKQAGFNCSAAPFLRPVAAEEPTPPALEPPAADPARVTPQAAPALPPPESPLPPLRAGDDPLLSLTAYQQQQVDWLLRLWDEPAAFEFSLGEAPLPATPLSQFDPADVRSRNEIFQLSARKLIPPRHPPPSEPPRDPAPK